MNVIQLQKFISTINPNDILVTSDLHFSHKNLIMGTSMWESKSQCRDFDDEIEHDTVIINNINKMVNENTILIHCGDFSFGREENIINKAAAIKCPIINIYGNHDHKIRDNILNQKAFMACMDYLEIRVNKQLICFFHYPISEWNEVNRGSIMCYGHTHQFDNTFKDRSMNVGLEANNYHPHVLTDIINKMNTIEVNKIHHNGERA